MSDPHFSPGKSSARRLVLLTVIMLGFALLTWGVALFSNRTTATAATAKNFTFIFIPAWLTLTISTVVISMWFAKFLMEAEKSRDNEVVTPAAPAHH